MASTLGKRGGRDVVAMVGACYLTLCSSKLKLSSRGTDAEVGFYGVGGWRHQSKTCKSFATPHVQGIIERSIKRHVNYGPPS